MGILKYFISIDLHSTYWNFRIVDKKYSEDHLPFKIQPIQMGSNAYGTNKPITFMYTINNIFFDILDSGIVVFLDYILLYSCTVKEHFMLLKKVLTHLH